ncbi:MAG: M48 family metalloprotease [Planctomycetia bacterium]|nr:M48 family metalloprotease [Planctomycetia bacterium]
MSAPVSEATDRLEAASPEVKRYSRLKQTAALLGLALHVVGLLIAALLVGPRLEAYLHDWVGDDRWLRLIAVAALFGAALECVSLPLDFWSGFVLEHRFQLSNQTLAGWLWKRIKGYLLGGPLGLGLLLGLYALLWYGGAWWWLLATAGFLLVTLVLGRLLPVLILPLFYKVTRLDNPDLLDRLRKLADGTGLNIEGVYRLHLSAETKKANAALAGLGKSRRVLLGDTLLDGFAPEEIEVVFAHEVGHHVHRHLVKMVLLSVVLTATGLWLVDVVLRWSAVGLGYSAFDDPAALPLVLLVLSLFGLLLMPAQNALSRFFEVQCDTYALRRTGRADAYRSAFNKLARMNKSDPDPNPFLVWLLYDHPPIRQRLELADRVLSS